MAIDVTFILLKILGHEEGRSFNGVPHATSERKQNYLNKTEGCI